MRDIKNIWEVKRLTMGAVLSHFPSPRDRNGAPSWKRWSNAALIVMVLVDAEYWIAISLMRWAPVLAAGLLAAQLANNALSPRR